MHKYHDGDGEPPYGWTAACARDELVRRFPDLQVLLPSNGASPEDFGEARVVLAGKVSAALQESMPELEWIQFPGSGAEHFFKASGLGPEAFQARGIRVLNCPGISRYAVAEHAMAMLLALGRGLPRAMRQQAAREWTVFPAGLVRGQTLGIVGLGAIGERVAKLARAFEMWVIGCKRDPERHQGNAHVVLGADRIDRVVEAADFLLLAAPLSPATRARFDFAALRQMKRTAFLINVSRGENVVEADLVRALREGVIAGAAIDTFGPLDPQDPKRQEALSPQSKLWRMPNVLISPNNAASSERYMHDFAAMVAYNYMRWRAGEPFASVVA
jgi:phosphoglycerate dehydrogenase-like enzyme